MDNSFLPRRGQNQNAHNTPQYHPRTPQRPVFRTPETVAAEEEQHPNTNTAGPLIGGAGGHKPPKHKRSFKEWLKGRTKKQWIIFAVIVVLVLGAGGFLAYKLLHKPAPVVQKAVITKGETPKPVEPITSKLTGLPISDATINDRPVTAVMIENSPTARPQSGINQAGVVFEAVAEGGITRFLTLFQDTEPDYIGPVRSVRPYYVQWLSGFDAAVAHVGGSADALAMLKRGEAKDLDQFFNPGPYHRISSRPAPHNMYSSVIALRELQQKKGYTSNFTGFARKPEAKSATPNATSIDFNISGAIYNPHYDYDAATNTYKRSEGGQPHIDQQSGQQLSPKVVVSLVMPQGSNGIYTTYNTLGSGEAYVFQDGILTKGTWHKASNKEQFSFTDANGTPLKLDPGQTWISVVGGSNRITYK
jgi:hypothetical protein